MFLFSENGREKIDKKSKENKKKTTIFVSPKKKNNASGMIINNSTTSKQADLAKILCPKELRVRLEDCKKNAELRYKIAL